MTTKDPQKKSVEMSYEKYPLLELALIKVAERPTEGQNKLFYNPRSIANFDPAEMAELRHSIRCEGLIEPLLVRTVSSKEGTLDHYELIAGERRLRSLQMIIEQDLSCYDESIKQPEAYDTGEIVVFRNSIGKVLTQRGDKITIEVEDELTDEIRKIECESKHVFPTTSGADLYKKVSCKVVQECSDERALRLAFTENDKSSPLTIQDEIELVERMSNHGMSQEEIADVLGKNVTWVSQTGSFRRQLPKEAFVKLMEGQMSRHVAVSFISHAPEVRQQLYDAAAKIEKEQSKEKIQDLVEEKELAEDGADFHAIKADKAKMEGDDAASIKEERAAKALETKAKKTKKKLDIAKKQEGHIKQGHIKAAQSVTGITPKKGGKMLEETEIKQYWVTGLTQYVTADTKDPLSGNIIPADYMGIMRRTAQAIMSGNIDPVSVMRTFMIDNDFWKEEKSSDEEDDFSKVGLPEFEDKYEEEEDD